MNERESDIMEFQFEKLDKFVVFYPENRTLVFDQSNIDGEDTEYKVKVTNLTISSKTYTLKVKYEFAEEVEAPPVIIVPIFEETEEVVAIQEEPEEEIATVVLTYITAKISKITQLGNLTFEFSDKVEADLEKITNETVDIFVIPAQGREAQIGFDYS